MAVLPFPTAGGVGAGPGIGLPKPTPNKPNPPAPAAKVGSAFVHAGTFLTGIFRCSLRRHLHPPHLPLGNPTIYLPT
jgi:hypothetical protein